VRVLVTHKRLLDNCYSAAVYRDLDFNDLSDDDVKYAFEQNVKGECFVDLGSEYYSDRLMDTPLGIRMMEDHDKLGFIVADLVPAILDELGAGRQNTALAQTVFESIECHPFGYSVILERN